MAIEKSAKISKVLLNGIKKRRFLDLGFINGSKVTAINKALGKSPTAFLIKGAVIAIRSEDAKKILIKEFASNNND